MRLCFCAVALCVSSVAAHATTITFNGLGFGNTTLTTYTEAGFTVQTVQGTFLTTSGDGDPAPSIFTRSSGTIAVTDGGLFTFHSVAIGNGGFFGGADYTLTGYLNGNQVYTSSGTYNHIASFSTISDPYSTTEVNQIDIALQDYGGASANLDNINVDPVAPTSVAPEPSSFALLGTGVLGIAGVLRRRFA